MHYKLTNYLRRLMPMILTIPLALVVGNSWAQDYCSNLSQEKCAISCQCNDGNAPPCEGKGAATKCQWSNSACTNSGRTVLDCQ